MITIILLISTTLIFCHNKKTTISDKEITIADKDSDKEIIIADKETIISDKEIIISDPCQNILDNSVQEKTTNKMDPVFMSHGGGPSFFIEAKSHPVFKDIGKGSEIDHFYRDELRALLPQPKAILIISAHWMTSNGLRVTANEEPSLLFDYGGFPPETYQFEYPVPHSKEVEDEVVRLLEENGIGITRDGKRGLDHGVFVPLLVVFPEAEIPVVQLSLDSSLDPQKHFEIGQALTPLTEQGVLIIGSGQTTHGRGQSPQSVVDFENWLTQTSCSEDITPEERKEQILNFMNAPGGRASHEYPDHFIPFIVCLGASQNSRAEKLNNGLVSPNMAMSNFRFRLYE